MGNRVEALFPFLNFPANPRVRCPLSVPRFNYVFENCMHQLLTFTLKSSLNFPKKESIFSDTHLENMMPLFIYLCRNCRGLIFVS